MNITGVVAEYNPFHKGHEYQLKKAREISGCDGIAVVMSGNFVQRGEPALIDKYKRAVAAIYGGADLVIELPMPFSCQNAEYFSYAALNELKKLQINNLSFGCEDEDITLLKEIAYIQLNDKSYDKILRGELKKGISYPLAVTRAVSSIFEKNIENIISSPNNVLGLEYIKSSIKLNMNINYIPIKRVGMGHNELNLSGNYDSATAIRSSILDNSKGPYPLSLTKKSSLMIHKFYEEYEGFNNLNNYLNIIYYKILDLGLEGLNDIYEITEGLNNKIYSNVYKYNNVDDFIMSLKSKRYTYSKLRRILLNILLNIRKNDISGYMLTTSNRLDIKNCNSNAEINNNFVKVLAFNDVGRKIIKEAKTNGVSIINRYSDYKKYDVNMKIFELTDKSTNLYYLPFSNKEINKEYKENAFYIQ